MAYSLISPTTSNLTIKKSRFLAWVGACESRAQALQQVQQAWATHPQATHVCWALIAGGESAAVDDGEPSGTAGRPMLEVLRHHQLDQVLALVVRYYGGIPLGAGGLLRAYTEAVAGAIASGHKQLLRPKARLHFGVGYELEGQVRRDLPNFEAETESVAHTHWVQFQVQVPQDRLPALQERLQHLSQGGVVWLSAPL